jgi:hypothetical protein
LIRARGSHTATLLPSGKVLIAGGQSNGADLTSAELYDPGSNSWKLTQGMAAARIFATATLLPDGRVLLAGGDNDWGVTNSVEIYDPASGTWRFTGSMNYARSSASATLLPGGEVLMAGGFGSLTGLFGTPLSTAELYVPSSAPDPPYNVLATPGALSATVTFHGPADDGNSAITSYRVTAIPGGRSVVVPGDRTSATVTGLKAGVAYRFAVTATNAFGTSASSAPSNAVIPAPVCLVPKLKGLSLTKARRALSAAHCAVGRVKKPRHPRGKLVVVKQSLKPGAVRGAGTKVGLTLGPPPKRRH